MGQIIWFVFCPLAAWFATYGLWLEKIRCLQHGLFYTFIMLQFSERDELLQGRRENHLLKWKFSSLKIIIWSKNSGIFLVRIGYKSAKIRLKIGKISAKTRLKLGLTSAKISRAQEGCGGLGGESSSVPEGAANFPAAVFLAGKCPNLALCCWKIGEEFSSSVEICRKTFPAANFGQPQPSRVFWKASCGETVVQKGVFGESVSSLPP